jgi:hypothetical protein
LLHILYPSLPAVCSLQSAVSPRSSALRPPSSVSLPYSQATQKGIDPLEYIPLKYLSLVFVFHIFKIRNKIRTDMVRGLKLLAQFFIIVTVFNVC